MSIGKRFWFGLGLGAAALALFFLTTDWDRLVDALAGANYWYVIPAVLLYQVSLLFRTARWQMLMRHMREVTIARLYPVVVVGYMANNILPLRIGELVRSYYVGQREGVSKTAALATILVERLMDALTLIVFVAVIAVFVPLNAVAEGFGDRSSVPWPLLAAVLSVPFAAVFALLVAVAYWPSRAAGVAEAGLRLLPEGGRSRGRGLVEKFIHALQALRSPSAVLVLFALSVPVWLFEGALFFVVGYSFDFHLVYGGEIEMAAALVLAMALANIGAAVPSSPGGIGLFELITRETLVLLPLAVMDRSVAGAYAAVVHAILLLPVIALGQAILVADGLSLRNLWRGGRGLPAGQQGGLE